ncbi:MAG: HAD-IA family hydrolase, partial [Candidatus Ratteibacteria bacterium]
MIFDFDGTLVTLSIDFRKIKGALLKRAREYKLKIPPGDLPILELLEEIKRLNGKRGNDFYFEGHRILKEEELNASRYTQPKEGVLELLKSLRKKGIKIGIITRNCREVVEEVIKKFGILYDVLLTRDDGKKVKPDSSHINECLRHLSLKKDEVILIGDHPFDIKVGKELNILSIGLRSENVSEDGFLKEGADFVFEDIEEIGYLLGMEGFKAGKLPNRFLRYLIERYTAKDKDVVVGPGIGIDCAIFKVKDSAVFVKTDPITLTAKDIGSYLVNINVNDISVMGGLPSHLLTVLLFPERTTFSEIEYVFSQIGDECKKFNIKWIGGHTEILNGISSPVAVGLLIGKKIRRLKRQKIKVGDKVFLLKEIGVEGASVIAREKYEELKKYFSERYLEKVKNAIKKPGISIYKEARILWENLDIKYLHDPTEGGISTSLYEMSEAMNIGLLIDLKKLRFYPPVIRFCKVFNLSPLGIISSGCITGIIDRQKEKSL